MSIGDTFVNCLKISFWAFFDEKENDSTIISVAGSSS